MSAFGDQLAKLLEAKPNATQRDWAAAIGMDEGSFCKLLKGSRPLGPKVVARICRDLPRDQAALLLRAYLLDQAQRVREECEDAPLAREHVDLRLPLQPLKRSRPTKSG